MESTRGGRGVLGGPGFRDPPLLVPARLTSCGRRALVPRFVVLAWGRAASPAPLRGRPSESLFRRAACAQTPSTVASAGANHPHDQDQASGRTGLRGLRIRRDDRARGSCRCRRRPRKQRRMSGSAAAAPTGRRLPPPLAPRQDVGSPGLRCGAPRSQLPHRRPVPLHEGRKEKRRPGSRPLSGPGDARAAARPQQTTRPVERHASPWSGNVKTNVWRKIRPVPGSVEVRVGLRPAGPLTFTQHQLGERKVRARGHAVGDS